MGMHGTHMWVEKANRIGVGGRMVLKCMFSQEIGL